MALANTQSLAGEKPLKPHASDKSNLAQSIRSSCAQFSPARLEHEYINGRRQEKLGTVFANDPQADCNRPRVKSFDDRVQNDRKSGNDEKQREQDAFQSDTNDNQDWLFLRWRAYDSSLPSKSESSKTSFLVLGET